MALPSGYIPDPLPPFGRSSIRDFLKVGLPCTSRRTLTATMQQNLRDYESLVKQKVRSGEIQEGVVVVLELDRAFGKKYSPAMHVDCAPCLKTQLRYLFVMSTHDFGHPDSKREFFRWIMPYERPGLQGVSPKVSLTLRAGDILHATGNAYPVNLLGAIMVGVLRELEAWSGFVNWPPWGKLQTSVDVPDLKSIFVQRLQKVMETTSKKDKGKNGSKTKGKSTPMKRPAASKAKGKSSVRKKPSSSVRKKPSSSVGKRSAGKVQTVLSHGLLLQRPKSKASRKASSDEGC